MAAKPPATFSSALGRILRETGSALKEGGAAEIFSRHRPIMRFQGKKPFKTNDTFVAPTASMIGDVTAWDQSSIWYKAVVRADNPHSSVTIGFSSSVGEGSVVMTDSAETLPETGFPADTHIGHYVTIGSGCVLKSCRIDDICVIGDKCTILEGALVEHHAVLESGSTVLPYQRIPSGQRWGGNPAKFIEDLSATEKEGLKGFAEQLHIQAQEHLEEFLPYGYSHVHMEDLEQTNQKTASG